jgi:DNA-binding FadR family transcriptional regulator
MTSPSPRQSPSEAPDIAIDEVLHYRRGDKVSQVIARMIVREIVEKDLQPGSVLPPESTMLAKFQIGRASLREALRILEIHGLIIIKSGPGGGPIVAGSTASDFGRMATLHFEMKRATYRELVEARLVLEPAMARQAAARSDPELVAHLRALVDETSTSKGSQAEDLRKASSFHGALIEASGNRVLDLIASGIKEVYFERVSNVVYRREHRVRVHREHMEIVSAIEKGDVDGAESLMRAHMEEFVLRFGKKLPGLMEEIVDWR